MRQNSDAQKQYDRSSDWLQHAHLLSGVNSESKIKFLEKFTREHKTPLVALPDFAPRFSRDG
jgi:hypothetical protein